MGESSISRGLTAEYARCWRRAHPGGEVIYRDLAAMAIPVIDAAWVAANWTPAEARSAEQRAALKLSGEFVAELLRAEEYVIGVPVHNWGPAAGLKLWVDQILRFGETVALTAEGPRGRLAGRRATFCVAAGAEYGGAAAERDYVVPWLRTYFGYLGVTEIQFVTAEGAAAVTHGRQERGEFLAPHLARVGALFGERRAGVVAGK